ncbi:beta-ketoacyl synthase N-terminal-like domain-containing protein [Methylocucumis oryzae]|uniref:beta-ketoacyl synthase N-terminal-like domain-containing protein n=1 Tax=Methylocucumis oryzae TaxID=1632867 RepID=UPI001EFA04CD|nr:beta-ketoacyl synthase N-terminal-like domain-containing protein [Methylocucumis oryzae]
MRNALKSTMIISGLGVVSAIGQGQAAFTEALLAGRSKFGMMQRPGRQFTEAGQQSQFIGAELAELPVLPNMPRNLSLSAHAALVAVHEAWQDASLAGVEPERIGLIVGGSNFQQRELTLLHDNYQARTAFIKPGYAMTFMDTDVCALLSDYFGIKGLACTVGGASASGQLALIQALALVAVKQVDVAIAVGALMDLSYWECQSFSSLGAMGSKRFASEPLLACRPCDAQRDGFIFGEACAAVVVERADTLSRLQVMPYAQVSASSVLMDASRTTQPNLAGEIKVVQKRLSTSRVNSCAD